MSDYGRIGDYIGPVAAKKLSAVDIDANSSNPRVRRQRRAQKTARHRRGS
ncbi:hypothetical protein [Bifidobacterium breve]|nr:hypothetical protein [Bifidobacterium breve]